MRQTAVLLGILVCGTAFAADSQLMNLVMPDAKILAGVNASTAISSPLGQFLLSKLGQSGQMPTGLLAAIGFNPLQDVTEILAATAADPSNPGGLIMARGTFPVDGISALLTAKSNGKWDVTTYGGATLISSTSLAAKVQHAMAFLGTSIALGGDLASVKAAIDRSTGSNSIDPALAVTVNQLSASEDEWLASSISIGSLLPAKIPSATPGTNPIATLLPLLKNVQSFNGGVKFGDTVAVTGEAVTSSSQNAAALDAVIKLGMLMAGSASANAAGNPQIAAAIQLLQTLQVSANGPAVDLVLSIPEAQIESIVNSRPAVIAGVQPLPEPRRELPAAHNGN